MRFRPAALRTGIKVMAKAYGYARVSTELQVTDGVSLEAQQAKFAAWCDLNGYEVGGVFVDAGLSGKRADNRPELQNALNAVCGNRGSALVVYSLSRLSRSTADMLAISARMEKAGADLVSLSEKIDTTSAAGRMVFRMLSVLSEFEREQISERVTTALAYKKSKNERVGQIPYGFSLSADGVTLEKNETEQEIVIIIQQLRAEGLSLRDIANELNSRGAIAKGGKKWAHTSIKSILDRAA